MSRKKYVSQYLSKYFDPDKAAKRIMYAVTALEKYSKDYDTIVFTGVSGALVAPEISRKVNKQLICVRKTKEPRHSCDTVEGYNACKKFIIIDDFRDSGATVTRVLKEMKEFAKDATCIGLLEMEYLSKQNAAKRRLKGVYEQ